MECITTCGGNKAQKWKGSRDSPEIELNRTQSIEFGNRTKSNTELCGFDSRTNRAQWNKSNLTELNQIVFNWVRQSNSIEHNPMNCVQLFGNNFS